jgi:hypothetical protein
MLRKLTHLLKSWEGSQLDGGTSKEILDLIERCGMTPMGARSRRPKRVVLDNVRTLIDKDLDTSDVIEYLTFETNWEPEK